MLNNTSIISVSEKKNFVDPENSFDAFVENNHNIGFTLVDDLTRYLNADTDKYDMIVLVDKIDITLLSIMKIAKKGCILVFINNKECHINKNSYILHEDTDQLYVEV